MDFRTVVKIDPVPGGIMPSDKLLFVGSCFADHIGRRFSDYLFRTVVNPYGVMYNPASVLHTIERMFRGEERTYDVPDVAVLTLGTNHVYILKETGEIVDNCEKRPQSLFVEKELSVEECAAYLRRCVDILLSLNENMRIILTVSPIRYAKYGFHGSQLSKATLLLAVNNVLSFPPSGEAGRHFATPKGDRVGHYFPAYEIVNDELRDYRFYQEDMLHPSDQAVTYICQRFAETYFSPETYRFVEEYRPIRQALNHRPFNPESEEYKLFKRQTEQKLEAFKQKYGLK